jgi:hypothetical protein
LNRLALRFSHLWCGVGEGETLCFLKEPRLFKKNYVFFEEVQKASLYQKPKVFEETLRFLNFFKKTEFF